MDAKYKIAKRLKELRKEFGLTQQQLSDKTGITIRSIRNYETEIREPNSKSMAILENFFNVSGAYLRGETNERNNNMIWDDPDINKEISNDIQIIIQTLINKTRCSDPDIQYYLFTIMTELSALLNLEDEDRKKNILELIGYQLHGITAIEKLKR